MRVKRKKYLLKQSVGASTSTIYCWSPQQSEKIWSLQGVGVVDSHSGVLCYAYARASASTDLCTSPIGDNETTGGYRVLSHISTTSVARDMLEILHKIDHEKPRYLGFSYDTMLGGVFAAMYLDKVEWMVNDGESLTSSSEELER